MKQWCGYLHSNGSLQLKRWTGDVGDYTTDCDNNDFVLIVIEPFEALDWNSAMGILRQRVYYCAPVA